MTKDMLPLKKLITIFSSCLFLIGLSSLFFTGTYSCGSSSSSDDDTSDDFTVETTVSRSQATSTSLSALTYGGSSNKAITLEVLPKKGDSVQAYDLDDNSLGELCTTNDEGKCSFVITQEEAEDGFILKATGKSNDPNFKGILPEIGIVIQPSREELDLGSIKPALTPDGDLIAALAKKLCDGDLASCKTSKNLDLECITKSLPTLMPSNDPETAANQTDDTLERQMGALMVSTRTASTKLEDELSSSLNDLTFQALDGDPTELADIGGDEIGDNKITMSNAVPNTLAMVSTINDSYCTVSSDTGKSPWQEVKELDPENFNPSAITAFLGNFSPDEIGEYGAEQLQAFAKSVPLLENWHTIFGDNDQAQKATAKLFTQGAFEDGELTTAIVAVGLIAATFPQESDSGEIDWTGFDTTIAAQAAHNSLLELQAAGTLIFDDPDTLVTKLQSVLSDPDNRLTFAKGSSVTNEMMGDLLEDPSGFDPTVYAPESPPGGICSTNDDCMPCYICDAVVKTCNAVSKAVGASCSLSTDCGSNSPLTCVTPVYDSLNGYCMCTSVVPVGVSVAGSSEGSSEIFEESDIPTTGSVGAFCTSNSQCSGSTSCVGSTCTPSDGTFKKEIGAPCSANVECNSNNCSNTGTCTAASSTSTPSGGTTTTGGTTGTTTGGTTSTTSGGTTTTTSGGTTTGGTTSGGTTTTSGGTTTTTSGGTTTTGGTPLATTYSGAWTPSASIGTKCPTKVSLTGKGTGPYTSVGITANFPTSSTCSGSLTGSACSSCSYTAGTGATNTGAKVVLSSCSGTCTGLTITKD